MIVFAFFLLGYRLYMFSSHTRICGGRRDLLFFSLFIIICIGPELSLLCCLYQTKTLRSFRGSFSIAPLNPRNRLQGQTDPWREFIKQLLVLLCAGTQIVQNLLKILDHKIDLATRGCSIIQSFCRFNNVVMYCTPQERERERECASMDRSVGVISKVSKLSGNSTNLW